MKEAGHGEIWSVTQIVQRIKQLLATEFPPLWIEGEISNYSRAGSGHRYFTLKDDRNQLKAALFRGRARELQFEPEDGIKVVAFGQVDLYGPRSEYQLIVEQLMPAGLGELELAFRQLHERLEKEGLFAADRKRPLPEFPRRIGIVTSARSAAVRDMLKVLGRRAPHVEVVIADTLVQGERAAAQIVAAIERFNRARSVDLLLVGRGGGHGDGPIQLASIELAHPADAIFVRPVVAVQQPALSAGASSKGTPVVADDQGIGVEPAGMPPIGFAASGLIGHIARPARRDLERVGWSQEGRIGHQDRFARHRMPGRQVLFDLRIGPIVFDR